MDTPNALNDQRKRMDAKGTIQGFKMKTKSQGMVKPVNSGASLASGMQQQSNYKFGKAKNMAKR